MSHTQTRMTAYKKVPAGTTVEVADGTILPVYGFGIDKVNQDQPGTTTKLVKMVSVAYVPGLSWDLLSTRKAVEQWGKPLVYYKTKAVLGFPGEESLVCNFCPRKGLFSATGVKRTPSQGTALTLAENTAEAIRVETTGQWGPRADMKRSSSQGTALALAAKTAEAIKTATGQWEPEAGPALAVAARARYVMKAYHVLADPEKETMEMSLDSVKETREVSLDPEEEIREGPLDPKEETREVPLDPDEGTQEAPSNPAEETREAPSDHEDETQGTPSDPEEETLEAPSDPNEETLEAPSDPEEETQETPSDHQEEAKDAGGPKELKGPVVPTRRKVTVGGNLPPNNVKAHVESAGARRRGRSRTAKFSAGERGRRRRECVNVRRRGHDDFSEEGGATEADSEEHVNGAVNLQQTMNAVEMEKWRKVRKDKCKVTPTELQARGWGQGDLQ